MDDGGDDPHGNDSHRGDTPGTEPHGTDPHGNDAHNTAPLVRASDVERQVTAQILQQAFSEGRLTLAEFDDRTTLAYQARFQTDLTRLTADLSPARQHHSGPRVAPVSAGSPVDRVTGGPGPSTSLAIMSGCDRKGEWTVPAEHTAVAVMGGVALDLTEATLESHETTIRAFAFWGGMEIVVPDDIAVVVDGLGLMGGFAEQHDSGRHDRRPVRKAPPGAPTIRVTGVAIMGGVEVRRVPRDTGRSEV